MIEPQSLPPSDSASGLSHGQYARRLTISLYDVIKVRTLCGPPFAHRLFSAMNIEAARKQMIEQQVHAWDVFDERVLKTMRQVQREEFAPVRYRDVAFADSAIPLAHGQTMLPAKVHGRILQALAVGEGDVALEVGAGTGYLSACLGSCLARALAGDFPRARRAGARQPARRAGQQRGGRSGRRHAAERAVELRRRSPSPARCRCTTSASSGRCGSAAGCSSSSATRRSWKHGT